MLKNKLNCKFIKLALLVGLMCIALVVGCAPDEKKGSEDAGPIKIGVPTPLSPPADYRAGEINVNTLKMAQKEINDSGGINGREIELIVADDEGKPSTGVSLVEKMITEDGVAAIMGVWHASVAQAQAEVAAEYEVPIFFHYSWPDEITEMHSDYIFRISPFNSQIAMLLLPFLEKKGYEHVAVMAEDTSFGSGFSQALKEGGEAKGMRVTVKTFPAEGDDFTADLLDLRNMDPVPDVLIVATVYHAMYLIPRQAHEVGLAPDADILAGWDYPGWSPEWWEVVGEFGKDAMYPTFYSEKEMKLYPKGEEFRSKYQEAYGEMPPIYAYYLYDCMMMLSEVMKKRNSSGHEEIMAGLKEIEYEGTTGTVKFECEPQPGPIWNQWMGHQLFVIQYTEAYQNEEDATVVYSSAQ